MRAPPRWGTGAQAPIELRRPGAADEPFLAHLRERAVAGDFSWFDDRPEEGAGPAGPVVSRLIVILGDGTRIGAVSWFGVLYGPNDRSRAWNIGITLAPEYRGRGYGALSQRMLADHLFAHTLANRVEAGTDVANHAEQRALERAGFLREGIVRGAQYRGGNWHDLVLYARVRADGVAVPPLTGGFAGEE